MRVLGVAGWSGSGKTTLIVRLLPVLIARGLTVSTLKHAHHAFDVDRPGKDSHRHREAGAHEVLIASSERIAILGELRGAPEPGLDALVARLAPVDLVLVEGFKRHSCAKIEVHRAALGTPLLAREDPSVRAVASDTPIADLDRPVLALDDIAAIADFVVATTGLDDGARPARAAMP